MNSAKWIWRRIGLLSAAATVLLLVGLVYAFMDINYPSSEGVVLTPSPETSVEKEHHPLKDKQNVNMVVLGDSLAKGTGDDTGSGFARRVVKELGESTGQQVKLLNNLGINGLTTSGLLPKLDESGMVYALKEADVILLSIGGNDLFQGAQALANNRDLLNTELDPMELIMSLPEAVDRLQSILLKLREINPEATIVYVGLYNPFGDLDQLLVPGNIAVTQWNNAALELVNVEQNMLLIPTFDLFKLNLEQYLANDHFHPNGDGYQQIAERIVQAIQ